MARQMPTPSIALLCIGVIHHVSEAVLWLAVVALVLPPDAPFWSGSDSLCMAMSPNYPVAKASMHCVIHAFAGM